ncbi:MAG TPA: hypothetical protein VFB16_08560 [Bauldia sp.]|nr:hypothetical protein [Bauldia sp.]
MSTSRLVAAVTAATIALGSLAVGTVSADAATMKKPVHHVLVCKAGSVVHKVKIGGKWVLRCHKVHPKMHKVHKKHRKMHVKHMHPILWHLTHPGKA